jgi:hypothetical protein
LVAAAGPVPARSSFFPLELPLRDGILPADLFFDEPMMTDKIDKAAGAPSRQDRLKSALRENLKRRKEQARERSRTTDPAEDVEASLDEGTAGHAGSQNFLE